jgi:hypothetical protein
MQRFANTKKAWNLELYKAAKRLLLHWDQVGVNHKRPCDSYWVHRVRFMLGFCGLTGKRPGAILRRAEDMQHYHWKEELLCPWEQVHFNWRTAKDVCDRSADVSISLKREKGTYDPVENAQLQTAPIPCDKSDVVDLETDPFCYSLAWAFISGGFGRCVYKPDGHGSWDVEQQQWANRVPMHCIEEQIDSVFAAMLKQVPVGMRGRPVFPASRGVGAPETSYKNWSTDINEVRSVLGLGKCAGGAQALRKMLATGLTANPHVDKGTVSLVLNHQDWSETSAPRYTDKDMTFDTLAGLAQMPMSKLPDGGASVTGTRIPMPDLEVLRKQADADARKLPVIIGLEQQLQAVRDGEVPSIPAGSSEHARLKQQLSQTKFNERRRLFLRAVSANHEYVLTRTEHYGASVDRAEDLGDVQLLNFGGMSRRDFVKRLVLHGLGYMKMDGTVLHETTILKHPWRMYPSVAAKLQTPTLWSDAQQDKLSC